MKFFTVSAALLSLLGAVHAAEDKQPVASASKVDSSSKPFSTDSLITKVTFPDSTDENKIPEFTNEKETRVQFAFINTDPETSVHVAGYFGSFYYNYNKKDPKTGADPAPYANLTSTKIGPLAVEPGKNVTFEGKIKVTLPPEDFDLVLNFFVGAQGDMAVVKHAPIRVSIVDPAVSVFDPKFLLAQIILALTVGMLGYVGYFSYLQPYLQSTKPVVANTPVKKGSVAAVVEKKKAGEKGYDESWIPKEHLSASGKPKKN